MPSENLMKHTQHMKFTTKEEYLAYRSEWKAQYKVLSKQIRDAKFCRWFCTLKNEERIKSHLAHFQTIGHKTDWTYWGIRTLSVQATNMLEQLQLAKQEAQSQYLAAKEQKEELVLA